MNKIYCVLKPSGISVSGIIFLKFSGKSGNFKIMYEWEPRQKPVHSS